MRICVFQIRTSFLPAVGMEESGLSGVIKSVICVWELEAGIILPSQGKHKYFKAHMTVIPLKLI